MRFDPAQLETLVAIAEEGTFEAAARRLHVTASAVSQRVRGLESAAGRVLVRRTTPCEVTAAGEPLVRLGRRYRLLLDEAAAELDPDGPLELPVAVNADSLATWFRDVLSAAAGWPATALRLAVEDQAYSHDLLRRGEVLAAVTSEPRPVQGCVVESLGTMTYVPAATSALIDRHRRAGGVDWSAMPVVVFNEKDHLQDEVLAAHGVRRPGLVHRVPTSADFHEAVRRGLGWGALPEQQLAPDLADGTLVAVPGAQPLGVPLFWQRWRLESAALTRLSAATHRAAEKLMTWEG